MLFRCRVLTLCLVVVRSAHQTALVHGQHTALVSRLLVRIRVLVHAESHTMAQIVL